MHTYTHTELCTLTGMHTHMVPHRDTTTHVSLHAPEEQLICVHTWRCGYAFPKESLCRQRRSHPVIPMCVHRHSNTQAYTCMLLNTYIYIDTYAHFCTQMIIHKSTYPHTPVPTHLHTCRSMSHMSILTCMKAHACDKTHTYS